MVRKEIDLTRDLDELTAIKRIDEIEIDLIDSWLCKIDKSQETREELQKLLELRYFCILRRRLLTNLESDFQVTRFVS